MKRNIFMLSVIVSVFALFLLTPAARAQETPPLPDKAGVYDVPGHPKLKLRVFVYNEKFSAKPTPTPPSAPVCSPDDDSTSIDGIIGWHLPGTVTYRLNIASVPSIVGSGNFSTIAGNSYSAWSASTNIGRKVAFNQGADTLVSRASLDGQNIITWGRTSGSALAVTYTWYNRTTNVVTENDTIFNLKFPWAWSGGATFCAVSGYYDAQDILTHELGHWMGLDDEYDGAFANNTMYGYGSKNEVKKDTLATGDVTAADSIYQ